MLVAVAVPCAGVQAGDAGPTSVGGAADATLTREGDAVFLTTRSRSFALAQYADGAETPTVLVESLVTRRRRVAADLGASSDPTGTVTLSVRPIAPDGRLGPPQASRELPGDAVEVASPSGIKVTSFGCCQQSNAETMLGLASLATRWVRSDGAPLTTYTRLGPPAHGRVVAVYLAMTPADDAVLGPQPSAVGLITVAGDERPRQRIRVTLRGATPRETALEWSAEVGWRSASGALEPHVVVDPAKPARPVWQWTIGPGRTIAMPLVDDRLDVAAATVPAGVALEALPLDAPAVP